MKCFSFFGIQLLRKHDVGKIFGIIQQNMAFRGLYRLADQMISYQKQSDKKIS